MKPLLSNSLRKLCSQTASWSGFFSAPLCIKHGYQEGHMPITADHPLLSTIVQY